MKKFRVNLSNNVEIEAKTLRKIIKTTGHIDFYPFEKGLMVLDIEFEKIGKQLIKEFGKV